MAITPQALMDHLDKLSDLELIEMSPPPKKTTAACAPHPRQKEFLALECEEALYGGAAGGGKTQALLIWLAEGVHIPTYSGIFFRRTYPQLEKSNDSPISKSRGLFKPLGGVYNSSNHRWTFPSGATIEFGHLPREDSIEDYQGPAYHRVVYDELTHFSEHLYTYLFSRMRKIVGFPIPMGIRAGTNPGGPGHLWVMRRFITAEAIAAIAGMDVRTPSPPGTIFWSTPNRAFVPARVADNPSLDIEDYIERMLTHLPPVLRERLLRGDWSIVENAIIHADWLRYYDTNGPSFLIPLTTAGEKNGIIDTTKCRRFATIDTAGTEKQLVDEKKRDKHSWSVIAIWDAMTILGKPNLFLRHVWRDKVGFNDLVKAIRDHCGRQSEWKPRTIHIEDAHFGRPIIDVLGGRGEGLQVEALKTATANKKGESGMPGKVERSTELQLMLEQGRVYLPQFNNDWKPDLEAEWLAWTGDPAETADQIDVASYAALVVNQQQGSWGGPIDTSKRISMSDMTILAGTLVGEPGLRW